jgi:hypothetical protein
VRLPVSPQTRRQDPSLPAFREARLIVGPSGRRYLASLADAVRYSPDQVAACYRERWEIEPFSRHQASHASQQHRLAQQATRAGATGNLGR